MGRASRRPFFASEISQILEEREMHMFGSLSLTHIAGHVDAEFADAEVGKLIAERNAAREVW